MIINLDSSAFPSLDRSIRARWSPIFLSPIRGSEERFVIGVAVCNQTGFHIEAANALTRLKCLYADQSDIVIQAATIALEELEADLELRGEQALSNFRPLITGVSIGSMRDAEGASMAAIGASWMAALSSLYRCQSPDEENLYDVSEWEDAPASEVARGDRLPSLVLDYVVEQRNGLARYFRPDLRGQQRRRRSHEVTIDYSGSKLVANFGTLQAGHVARSVHLIKRRLWDLKVGRDGETGAFHRNHELLIQMPSPNDPQVSDKQFKNLQEARLALEEQADQEDLRLEAFTSVEAIGKRVLMAEQ